MEQDKSAFLEAMGNLVDKRREQREKAMFDRNLDQSKNLAKGELDKDTLTVKGKTENLTPTKTVVGKTDKISTLEPKQNILSAT